MKTIIRLVALSAIGVCMLQHVTAQAQLRIVVEGITQQTGVIQISIYHQEQHFPKSTGQYRVEKVPVTGTRITHVIKDLPPGDYAVAIFHDRNKDGVCNLNFLGVPTEPYGFSKNYKPVLRAPTWAETRIAVQGDMGISIRLLD